MELERTRSAALGGIHMALTHGPLPDGGGGMEQPVTTHGEGASTTFWPITFSRGLNEVCFAWPPWLHMTCALTCSRNAIQHPFLYRLGNF
jgi:hypothetical protein